MYTLCIEIILMVIGQKLSNSICLDLLLFIFIPDSFDPFCLKLSIWYMIIVMGWEYMIIVMGWDLKLNVPDFRKNVTHTGNNMHA